MGGKSDRTIKLTRIDGDSEGGAQGSPPRGDVLIEIRAKDRDTALTHVTSCTNLMFSLEVIRDALATAEKSAAEKSPETLKVYFNILDEVETIIMANINAMVDQYKFKNTEITDRLVADYTATIIDGGKHIDEATARNTAVQVMTVVSQRLKYLITRAAEMKR